MNHKQLKEQLDDSIRNYAVTVQDLIYDNDFQPETDNEHRLLYLLDDLCRYNHYALSDFRDIIVEHEKKRG